MEIPISLRPLDVKSKRGVSICAKTVLIWEVGVKHPYELTAPKENERDEDTLHTSRPCTPDRIPVGCRYAGRYQPHAVRSRRCFLVCSRHRLQNQTARRQKHSGIHRSGPEAQNTGHHESQRRRPLHAYRQSAASGRPHLLARCRKRAHLQHGYFRNHG